MYECIDQETKMKRVCKVLKRQDHYKFLRELKITSELQVPSLACCPPPPVRPR